MITGKLGRLACCATVAVSLSIAGCGPPRAAPEDQRLIASLRTAISAQSTEWLDKNAALLEERRAAGTMSDEAYETFKSIIETAKAGNWDDAEQQVIAFQKAQRPTREQIDSVTGGSR